MLTVEEIKKIFDNFEVEGFSLENDGDERGEHMVFPDGECLYFHNDFNELAYPLFLQRVIESINKSQKYLNSSFIQGDVMIEAYREYLTWTRFDYEQYNSVDEAKEQAIKYILENL